MNKRNYQLQGSNRKPILIDTRWDESIACKGHIVFLHGYKGFKDWGCWNQMANRFAENGYLFSKVNFSHNGTSPDAPSDFVDLDAFGKNTYSMELNESIAAFRFLNEEIERLFPNGKELKKALMGHSRGGGIALCAARMLPELDYVLTLSAVSDFGDRFPYGAELMTWEETGVYYTNNKRTGQDLPHNFSWYKDYLAHEDALNIRVACYEIDIPSLHIHAADDEAVHPTEAFKLSKWCPKARLIVLPKGGHTLGSSHPWESEDLPDALEQAIFHSLEFLKKA